MSSGAYVTNVMSGLAAEKAGVKVGDIIVDLGGYSVDSVTSLTRMLRRFEPGQTVSLTVVRNGQKVYLAITLGENPREEASTNQNNNAGNSGSNDDSYSQWYDSWKDFLFPFFGIG